MEHIFTDENISNFCKLTRDMNDLHNPEFMREKGKLAIVPGMLILTYTANIAGDFLMSRANNIEAYFNSFLSSGEEVDLYAISRPLKPLERILFAYKDNGSEEILSSGNNHSRLYQSDSTGYKSFEGVKREFGTTSKEIGEFANKIKAKNEDIAGFLFSIAFSTNALFESVVDPQSEKEKEVSSIFNNTEENKKILPAYKSFKIFMPDGFRSVDPGMTLDYITDINKVGTKGRDFMLDIECRQEDNILYRSVYELVAIPKKILIRRASNIPYK